MGKTVRLEDDTHASLATLKGDDETFDDLVSRLVERHRDAVKSGAGLWAGSDAPDHARAARESMKEDVGR
ncbi:MAG: DUF7557 family protein [Halococcoides sp.]